MKNFVANGNSIQIVAPVGGVVGGQPYKQGSLMGIVVADAAEGEYFTLNLTGAYTGVLKTAGTAWAIGDQLYWDVATSSFTKTSNSGANIPAGFAYTAALSAATTGDVILSN